MPPCMHDLGRARRPGLLGALADLVQRQRVGVGVGAALRERAEPAAGVADVGEVDVPGDDVRHVVTVDLAAQPVGDAASASRSAPSAPSRAIACASVSPAGSRSACRSAAATSPGPRAAGRRGGTPSSVLARANPSHRRPRRSRRGGHACGPSVSIVTCRSVRPRGSPQPPSGSCHGSRAAPRPRRPGRCRVGERGDVRATPRVEPRLGDVRRVDRQPLAQREARRACDAARARRSAARGARGSRGPASAARRRPSRRCPRRE